MTDTGDRSKQPVSEPPLLQKWVEALVALIGYTILIAFVPLGVVLTYAEVASWGLAFFVGGLLLGGGTLMVLASILAVTRRSASVTRVVLDPGERKSMAAFNSFFTSSGWREICGVLGLDFELWNRLRMVATALAVATATIFGVLNNYENNEETRNDARASPEIVLLVGVDHFGRS